MSFSVLKPLSRLIMFAANRDWTRRLARLALKPFRMKQDVAVKTADSVVYVNSVDRLIAAQLWKRSALSGFEAELYRKAVKEGMTVLEIGANIGFFTLLFSRLAGEKGKVFAFEPDPDNFRLLEKNAQANGCTNTVCVKKAVSDRTGTEQLFVSEEHRGDHRLFDSHDGRPSVEVETRGFHQNGHPGRGIFGAAGHGKDDKELFAARDALRIFPRPAPQSRRRPGRVP